MANIIGIDEVGRGCWAGPLVAAAVLLDAPIEGLRDSKKLSKKRREKLDEVIRREAAAYGIGWVTPTEVDALGLTKSVQLAMLRAMKQINADYDVIVIDGNTNFFRNVNGLKTQDVRVIVKADDTIPAVSAASIIAKVARDIYMAEQDQKYPMYGFGAHVGYGTASHIAALKQHGVCSLHRKSYKPVREIMAKV